MRTRQLTVWLFTIAAMSTVHGIASAAAQAPPSPPTPTMLFAEELALPRPPAPPSAPLLPIIEMIEQVARQGQGPTPGRRPPQGQPNVVPPSGPAPQAQPPNPPQLLQVNVNPQEPNLPVNIRVDLTVTEQQGGASQSPKVVSTIVADGYLGRVRSSRPQPGLSAELNVDAVPKIIEMGAKLRLKLDFSYNIRGEAKAGGSVDPFGPGAISIQESMMVILESGKPLQVSQSADPTSDRKVSVEVKATIMK